MDEDTRRELNEIRALVKDNHRMLRSIRRGQFISMVTRVIIWIVVLALPLYLYQEYLAPTIAKISEISGVPTSTANGFFGLPSSTDLQNLINSVKNGQ